MLVLKCNLYYGANRSKPEMTKDRQYEGEPCPVARALDVIGERWCLLIVRDAFDGLRRFSEFQRHLGVARNILADRLRRLVEAGILAARPVAQGSAYEEYVLTPRGENLFPIVVALRQWGEQQLYAPGERHSDLIEKKTGKAVPVMAPRGAQGRVLLPEDTEVRKSG